jgi:hypothetical protein
MLLSQKTYEKHNQASSLYSERRVEEAIMYKNHPFISPLTDTQGPRLLDLLPTPPAPGGAEASLPIRLGVAIP